MTTMPDVKPPFDNEPAEGSSEVIDKQLQRQERERNGVDHLPGVKVSGQPQGGVVNPSD
jgi:hypothetical protein